ncbi:hypothetical protein Plhal304r1_c040g0117911 [Plasmopara halstedii]
MRVFVEVLCVIAGRGESGNYMLRPSAPGLTRASGVQAQMEGPSPNILTETHNFLDVSLCVGTETLV